MDIRLIFKEISEQLLSKFRLSAEVKHPGGKGDQREDFFRNFLIEQLPRRYGVGRGEVITPENKVSGELDIVIYDPDRCPALVTSNSHSIYPIESIYGAISIKSHLDSGELKEAYKNIISFKEILIKNTFTLYPNPGFSLGLARPVPVTGIVAYGANRSFEAIAEQVLKLDSELSDISLRPDFVVVIGQGIIGPRQPLRGDFNSYNLPQNRAELIKLRKTGQHTLLRVYMQLLRELNTITLCPFDFHAYEDMPKNEGPFRVKGHDTFIRWNPTTGKPDNVTKLAKQAIQEIADNAVPISLHQHYLNSLGVIPIYDADTSQDLDRIIYEYNPKKLPPITTANRQQDQNGKWGFDRPVFIPVWIEIDGSQYAIDISALPESYFEINDGYTLDELMSR